MYVIITSTERILFLEVVFIDRTQQSLNTKRKNIERNDFDLFLKATVQYSCINWKSVRSALSMLHNTSVLSTARIADITFYSIFPIHESIKDFSCKTAI